MRKLIFLLLMLPFAASAQTIFSYQNWADGGSFGARISIPHDSTTQASKTPKSDLLFIAGQIWGLGVDAHYHNLTGGSAPLTTVPWDSVTGTPNSLSGYGITDAVNIFGFYSDPSWLIALNWNKVTGFGIDSVAAGFHTQGYYDQRYSSAGGTVHVTAPIQGDGSVGTPLNLLGWSSPGALRFYGYDASGTIGLQQLGTAAFIDKPVSGNASAAQVVLGNDTRWADSAAVLRSIIATLLTRADSNQSIHSYYTVGRGNKLADSLVAIFLTRIDSNQSIHSWASIGRLNKLADSLRGLLYNANALQGFAVANTTPTTGYVLTWNGTTWAPAPASGGGGTPAGVTGQVQINKLGSFSVVPRFSADTLTNIVSATSLVALDTLHAKESADTIIFVGYSITLGLTGPVAYRYTLQLANTMGLFEMNNSISGTRLVKLANGDSSLQERWTTAIPAWNIHYKYLVVEETVNDAGSGGTTPVDSTRYKTVWDSLYTNILAPKGWTTDRVIIQAGSIVGVNKGTGGNLSPGAANEIAYKNIAISKAIANGARYFDNYAYMLSHGGLALLQNDSLHPNQWGHNVMLRGLLQAIKDSLSFVKSNSAVVEKRLTVQGDADIIRANVSGTTSTADLKISGSVFNSRINSAGISIPVYSGLKIFGDQVIDTLKWRLYYGYTGPSVFMYGLGMDPTTNAIRFYTPSSASNAGWDFGTINTTDSSFAMKARITHAGGARFGDSVRAVGSIVTEGKITAADFQLDGTSVLPPVADKLLLWHSGNTKFGFEMLQMGTPYFTRIFAPSTSGYGVRIGNKSTSDGTTWTDYQWYTSAGMFTTPAMLPNQAGADSVVTTTTSASVVTYGRKSLASFAPLSGTYTPTVANTSNVASSSAGLCQWTRIGNQIHVWGRVSITPTLTATGTSFDINLPTASVFTTSDDAAGNFSNNSAVMIAGGIIADAVNAKVVFSFTSVNTASNYLPFSFDYIVK